MKHLLSLTDLSKNEINTILEVATQMRRIVMAPYKKGPQLIGCNVAGVWDKPCLSSTAFSLASGYLSGICTPIFGAENIGEQCAMLENMGANIVAVSYDNDNLVRSFSKNAKCSVINASSSQCNPIGVLADIMALATKLDGLQNLSILAVGNDETNKINELNYVLGLYNSSLVWYLPKDDFVTTRKGIVIDKIDVAFTGADAVIDLGLANFSDPAKYYGSNGGITEQLMNKARIDAPLVGNRYIVDSLGIKEYKDSVVNTRQSCYVSVVMAVLYLMHKE